MSLACRAGQYSSFVIGFSKQVDNFIRLRGVFKVNQRASRYSSLNTSPRISSGSAMFSRAVIV